MTFPVNTKFNTLRRRQSRLFQSYLLPAWITSDSRSAVTAQHLDVNQLSAPAPTPCWVPATAPACILETPNGAVHVNTIPCNLNSKPVSGVFTHTAMIASVRVGHKKHEATKKLPHWCVFQLPMIKGKCLLEILKNCGWQHHLKTLCSSFPACFRTTLTFWRELSCWRSSAPLHCWSFPCSGSVLTSTAGCQQCSPTLGKTGLGSTKKGGYIAGIHTRFGWWVSKFSSRTFFIMTATSFKNISGFFKKTNGDETKSKCHQGIGDINPQILSQQCPEEFALWGQLDFCRDGCQVSGFYNIAATI